MAAISKIKIDGFKAFPKEFELDLKGKNLLMYGENGSGKSSIYYALHALLQSQYHDKGSIYFDKHNSESLVNKYTTTANPYIEIELEGSDTKYHLSQDGYKELPAEAISPLRDMNAECVFINHKFLFNSFSFRNSQYIDLFPVFIKDILPFTFTKNESKYISELYDEVVAGIQRKGRGLQIDPEYTNLIDTFNQEVLRIIDKINHKDKQNDPNALSLASIIYNNHFRDLDDRELSIELNYEDNKDHIPQQNKSYWLRCGYKYQQTTRAHRVIEERVSRKLEILSPVIRLIIKEKKEDGTWSNITKPQTQLNEAKLTAIILSIRFSLLDLIAAPDGRFLALDDMLISLDMSNRMKVIKYLLDVVALKYKLYVFTHDRLLFNSLRKYVGLNKQQDGWICGGIYMHDRDNSVDFRKCIPYPVFIEEKDAELEAKEYYIMHDYPACGQRLRKWCEGIFEKLYPDQLLKMKDNRTGKTVNKSLNDQILCLNNYCLNESIDFEEFKDLKIYKDNVLNAVSHYDISSPIYGNEILSIIKILSKLEQIANNKKAIQVNHDLAIELIASDGRPVTICIDIRSNKIMIVEYGGTKRISYYTKCVIYKIIDAGRNIDVNPKDSYDNIYEAYTQYCKKYGADSTINLLDILYDHGTLVKNKF